jgi:hypothetical protein
MPQELFNQDLINSPSEPDNSDRIAFGQPGVTGGKNVLWSRLKQLLQGAIGWLDFTPQDPAPSHSEGRMYYSDVQKAFVAYNDISDVALQIGEETWARVLNNTGSLIPNGTACYVSGVSGTSLLIEPAIANNKNISIRFLGLATNDIANGAEGYITRYGAVRDVNTSSWPANTVLYLSPTDAGELVGTRPDSPDYIVRIGLVGIQDAVNGIIAVDTLAFNGTDTTVNIEGSLNGIVTKKQSIDILVDTGVIYFETDNENTPADNLPFIISGERYFLDTTTGSGTGGKARVALTAGTSTIPTTNYVYVLESGGVGVLTANTTGFPANSAPVAVCSVLDVTNTNTYGALIARRFNNAPDNGGGDGIFQYLSLRLRLEGSKYVSGVDPTVTITTNPSAIDGLKVTSTSGLVFQMHSQTFQAKDGTEYYVVNHPTTPYLRITDLSDIDVDANGDTLRGNNTRYGLNLFGGQNSGDEVDRVYVMLPTGNYSTDANAINDVFNYAVTSVPFELRGTAFRTFRIVVNYSTSSSGTFTNLLGAGGYQDERGQPLGVGGGGAGSGAAQTDFSDTDFSLYNNTDATKILQFLLSGITTGNTRTLTVPDISGLLAVAGMVNAFSFGGQAHGGSNVKTFAASATFNANDGNNQYMEVIGDCTILISNLDEGTMIIQLKVTVGTSPVITIDSSLGDPCDNSATLINANGDRNKITIHKDASGVVEHIINTTTA